MAPHRFQRSSSHRSTPLPEGRYSIPGTLPPTFGVHELFDWSSTVKSPLPSSARSVSAGFSTFQRYWQKAKPSSSVAAWVKDQEGLSTSGPNRSSPGISSIATSPNEQSQFAPRQSPTPAKRSRAPPQLPTPSPSPLKLEPKGHLPKVSNPSDSSKNSSQSSAPSSVPHSSPARTAPGVGNNRGRRSVGTVGYDHSASVVQEGVSNAKESSDPEIGYSDEESFDEGDFEGDESEENSELESEDQSEEESEVESELNGEDGRMRASRYINCEAREASRDTKINKSRPSDNASGVDNRWTGGTQGAMQFRRRPNSTEAMAPGKWSFSNAGVERQPLKDREVGDVHFSPVYPDTSGNVGEEYWVVVRDPKRQWVRCVEGQAHPVHEGYVLRPRTGTKPLQWIRAQSLRTNKWRERSK
ncbi:hypothetical protein FRC08_008783 [Ceratobasidium sp. 394]|nr:hypothetical protein FRC08_008783 [Ceratobasidium sp. 394]